MLERFDGPVHLIGLDVPARIERERLRDRLPVGPDGHRVVIHTPAEVERGKWTGAPAPLPRRERVRDPHPPEGVREEQAGGTHTTFSRTTALK